MEDLQKAAVPRQEQGAQKDFRHEVQCESEQEAVELFETARLRLVDVNHWDSVCRGASATFCLTDEKGEALEGIANEGDFIQIDIPGPGTREGDGYDWVRVERIEYLQPEPGHEMYVMRVRPSTNPRTPGNETAHFLDEKATSTFAVERAGTTVMATIHGRNETPNTESNTSLLDKARNLLVGKSAIAGVANVQWNNLVHGLLK